MRKLILLSIFIIITTVSFGQSPAYSFSSGAFHIGYSNLQFLNDVYLDKQNRGAVSGGHGVVFGFERQSHIFNTSIEYTYNGISFTELTSSKSYNHGFNIAFDFNVFRRFRKICPFVGVGFGANFLSFTDKALDINSRKNIYMPTWRTGINFRLHPLAAIYIRYSQGLPSSVSYDGMLNFGRRKFSYSNLQVGIVGSPIFSK